LGKSERLNGGGKKPSILANAYEALIGAIYLDSGFHKSTEIIWNHIKSFFLSGGLSFTPNDYKSLLQQYVQQAQKTSPQYQVIKEIGPDHDKRFEVSVIIQGEVKAIGFGKSKKEAEQEAAKKALNHLGYKS